MSDLFSFIYETLFGLFNSKYSLVFDTMYSNGGYTLLGLVFIFIPLIMLILFYFLWKYPYGKFWHWLLWLLITSVVVAVASWQIASNTIFMSDNQQLLNALSNAESGYESYANTLLIKYAIYNGLLAIVIGFFYSLFLKQFSKIQIHLPF